MPCLIPCVARALPPAAPALMPALVPQPLNTLKSAQHHLVLPNLGFVGISGAAPLRRASIKESNPYPFKQACRAEADSHGA